MCLGLNVKWYEIWLTASKRLGVRQFARFIIYCTDTFMPKTYQESRFEVFFFKDDSRTVCYLVYEKITNGTHSGQYITRFYWESSVISLQTKYTKTKFIWWNVVYFKSRITNRIKPLTMWRDSIFHEPYSRGKALGQSYWHSGAHYYMELMYSYLLTQNMQHGFTLFFMRCITWDPFINIV